MKIAIISDIHGNLEALKSVLNDIESRNIDKIYCLGDIIAKGSHPKECIDLVKEKCEIVLRGNCDEYYASDIDLSDKPIQEIERMKWNKSKLDDEHINYLANLPFCHEFYMSGRLIRLVHAHPERIDKFAGNIDTLTHIYELVLPSDNTISNEKADVLIYGHIHTQYVQKIYNRYIINTGSVGNSIDVFRNSLKDGNVKNTAVANYLILSGNLDSRNFDESFSFELVSIPYDIEKEIDNSKDNIELDSYSEELRSGMYRDMEKIYDSFASRGINKEDI
jgi:protein phosphatase